MNNLEKLGYLLLDNHGDIKKVFMKKNYEDIELLLENKIYPSKKLYTNKNIIQDQELLRLFLKYIDYNKKSYDKFIYHAIDINNINALKIILDYNNKKLDYEDILLYCTHLNLYNIIEIILMYIDNPDDMIMSYKRACIFNHNNLIKLFLNKNINPNMIFKNPVDPIYSHINNLTGLKIAVLSNNLDMAELLLEYGADCNLDDQASAYNMSKNRDMYDFILLFDSYNMIKDPGYN